MAKDLEVAILFADVVGSTQLYDKFGDTKASETVASCLDVMKASIFPIWHCKQVVPLFDYMIEQSATRRPMALTACSSAASMD